MAHMKFVFADPLGSSSSNEWNSPAAVAFRKALEEAREASRLKEALKRAKSDPVVATRIAVLESRRVLATSRVESLGELSAAEGRTFTRAEGRCFDEAIAEMDQIDRELRGLIRG